MLRGFIQHLLMVIHYLNLQSLSPSMQDPFLGNPLPYKHPHGRYMTMSTHHQRPSRLFQQILQFIYSLHNVHVQCSHKSSRCNCIGLHLAPKNRFVHQQRLHQQQPSETSKSARTRRTHKIISSGFYLRSIKRTLYRKWNLQRANFRRRCISEHHLQSFYQCIQQISTYLQKTSPFLQTSMHKCMCEIKPLPTFLDCTSQGPLMSRQLLTRCIHDYLFVMLPKRKGSSCTTLKRCPQGK